MRQKTLKLIVTFYTTTAAMAMEKACTETGTPGRLIPVPREITAGCGMSWATQVEARAEVEKTAAQYGIQTAGYYELIV